MRTKCVQFWPGASAREGARTEARAASETAAVLRRSISALEFEPHADLGVARGTQGSCHLAELRVAEERVRGREARRVREVEELPAHLQLHGLVDRELLAEGEVGVVDAVAAQVREVAGRVAGDLVAGVRKASRVEGGLAS